MWSRLSSGAVLVVYALLLAAGIGLASAFQATSGDYPFGGVRVGTWIAWPRVGSREADPYARAVVARNGDIPLAVGEGLMLTASVDDSGQPLDGSCLYRLGGETPSARFWTLTFYDAAGQTSGSEIRRSGFTSAEILRNQDGGFVIVAAPNAQSGNWVPIPTGRIYAVLRLYDTPVSASSGTLERRSLPTIERGECQS